MQIILLVETRASCESDYRYIKSAIDYFYVERSFKLSKIYAKNKSELIQSGKKIHALIGKYPGNSVVIVCADYDRGNDPLNKEIIAYCVKNSYELVWMNLDVEEVFLGKQIPDKKKNKESLRFLTIKNSVLSSIETLDIIDPMAKHPASNLLRVLDKYLQRKT